MMVFGNKILQGAAGYPDVRGEQLYDTPVTNSDFVVPEGVHHIHVVAVQAGGRGLNDDGGKGGDLAYVNMLPVTPLETLQITTDNGYGLHSTIKRSAVIIFSSDGTGATAHYTGQASTGVGTTQSTPYGTIKNTGGGGGAAGYSANGGSGSGGSGYGGQKGGGSYAGPAGTAPNDFYYAEAGGSGGGVGLFGEGASGATWSKGGSGGADGHLGNIGSDAGGLYGGGGGGEWQLARNTTGSNATGTGYLGGIGGLRIVWGNDRAFPSTDVGLTV